MATRNPFGTVALGQEGSGLAQILTPYDSAKYDNAIIEQEQANRKEEAKALKEVKKDFKLGEMVELDKSWEKDIDTYSSQFKELYDEEVSLFTDAINVRQINDYDTFLNESDKLTRRWAEHNKKAKLYNEDVYLSTQNKETFDKADAFAKDNQNEIDIEVWDKRKKEFTNPPDYVMKEAGGDLQRARIKYLKDYCDNDLVPQRFVHEDFQKEIRALTAQTAEKKGGGGVTWTDNFQNSGVGGFIKSDGTKVIFSDDEEKAIVLANISNNKRALDYYRKEPLLEQPLKEYTKKIGKNDVSELSYREMYDFMAKDPAAMDFMKSQYFWKDEVKSSQSFSQSTEVGGSGAVPVNNDGTPVRTEITDVKNQFPQIQGMDYVYSWYGKKDKATYGNTYVDGLQSVNKNDLAVKSNATITPIKSAYIVNNATGEVVDINNIEQYRNSQEVGIPNISIAPRVSWNDGDREKVIRFKDANGNEKTLKYGRNEIVSEEVYDAQKRGDILSTDIKITYEPIVATIIQPSGKTDKYTYVVPYNEYSNWRSGAKDKYGNSYSQINTENTENGVVR